MLPRKVLDINRHSQDCCMRQTRITLPSFNEDITCRNAQKAMLCKHWSRAESLRQDAGSTTMEATPSARIVTIATDSHLKKPARQRPHCFSPPIWARLCQSLVSRSLRTSRRFDLWYFVYRQVRSQNIPIQTQRRFMALLPCDHPAHYLPSEADNVAENCTN